MDRPAIGCALKNRWVDGPRYSLDIWSTTGPSVWLGTLFAGGAGAELGVLSVFGTGPTHWSAGVSLDSAVEFSPVLRGRSLLRQVSESAQRGAMGCGRMPCGLRGQLGYDFVHSALGAIHANVWLSVHSSVDRE